MKKAFFFLALFINATAFSQSDSFIKINRDLELKKISNNAYLHVSYSNVPGFGKVGANGLLFISGSKAFLIDSPWTNGLTADLFSWITDTMKLSLEGFVPTHWHADCMGGLEFVQKMNVSSYANQVTIEIAKSKNMPVPDNGFNDSLQLSLDGKVIKCYFFGAAHSMDNIVVWIPSEKILFGGCMIKSLDSQSLGNIADGDLNAYQGTVERVIKKFPDAVIVIPGHGETGGIELLAHTRDLASSLRK